MLLIIGLLISLIVGILLYKFTYSFEDLGTLMTATSTILLFVIVLIALPLKYYSTKASIQEFKAIKSTVATMRDNGEPYESVGMHDKIISSNAWLASEQYANTTTFDIFIPDEIDSLQPIK